jgi:hypothetical protein
MITGFQIATICQTLEARLQELGFVLLDVQFDETANTLSIVLDDGRQHQLPCLMQQSRVDGATIDARLLWNILRDLINLGVMSPAIRLRKGSAEGSRSSRVL